MKLNVMEEKLDKVLEITNFVDKFESLEKKIREKDLQIENLQKTIEVIETKITTFLENNVFEKSKEENHTKYSYNDKIESMVRKIDWDPTFVIFLIKNSS